MNEVNATNVADELDLIETIRYVGDDQAEQFFAFARRLLHELELKPDDKRLSFTTTANRRLAFTIGQRYCLAYVPEENYPWHFISGESLPTTADRTESSYSGAPTAFYERCATSDDIKNHFKLIVRAAQVELNRANKSGFSKHSNALFGNVVAIEEVQALIMEKAKLKPGEVSGRVWKLGCTWGQGKPSFYDFIKEEKIVLGDYDNHKHYQIGDLIMLTDGFHAKALALVTGEGNSLNQATAYNAKANELSLPAEDQIQFYPAEWYELPEALTFYYKHRQGKALVKDLSIQSKVKTYWANRAVNYWLFQGNPEQYGFEASLRQNALNNWLVKAHQDKMTVGDKVIIWISGKTGGCIALAEITSPPAEMTESDAEHWKAEPITGLRAGIRITHNFIENPIRPEEIKNVDALKTLKAGNQGTNFRSSYEEYQALLALRNPTQQPHQPIKMHHLALNTIFYGPPGTGKTYKMQGLMRDHFIDKNAIRNPREVLAEKLQPYPLWKVLAAALSQFKTPTSVAQIHETELVMAKLNPETKMPRNSIWRTLQSYADATSTGIDSKYKAAIELFTKNDKSRWSIIPSKVEELNDILDAELLALAKSPLAETTEPVQIINKRYRFITFHQKYGYEDFIEGIKPVLQESESEEAVDGLQFTLKKGIFYEACLQALKLAGYASFAACYEDSQEVRAVKFKSALDDPTKHFALFIDEINRANISAVFGELITLLEDDKRAGAEHEMWVKLPSSGEHFSVPANLYVIGTMNTADRSIALLDIALRRRFKFEGLYPEYVDGAWWKDLLLELNKAIYKVKKNADLFIGHAFFIKKNESERSTILNHKIIPLLHEYCQNNQEQVKTILREAKIEFTEPTIENNFQLIAK
ncbi:MAG: hypothetical protein C0424_05035 [Sphingobacteriaceae bacterium]|nr:hypothetical protein [Sphingobacteriaceae bacterium]